MGDQDLISEMEQVLDQQSCFLSDDLIIEEILTRLPVKSILRFKSVSKQWYSTLSSSDFANAHLIKSPFLHPSTPVDTLFIQSGSNCYIFSYNDDQISGNFQDNLVNLDPSEFWVQKDDLVLTGCCNGLICFTPLYNTHFIIWNPATRKMHKYESDFRNSLRFFSGFGYVSSVDDYKYVHVTSRKGSGSEKSNHIVHIFSLKENKWKRLDFYAQDEVFTFGESVLINEILYWRASFPGADHFILSFDLGVEMFDIVNLDPGPGNILGVMGECLSKCESSYANTGEMLMHICESTGAMVMSIGVPEGLSLNLNSQMIGFTRTGKFFATGTLTDDPWDSQCRRLGIVDTATKPAQYTTLLKFDERINIARYVPSLVSPFPVEELSRA